ncbi:3-deoxy-manno-octulosonate-8-phosphatase KdsC [Methylomonas koyamae]|uniref:3-deoxy-manno-octulosonate-8-phosphatase KdsC n=1 Tax=Methylomonas koyamae TaxID=702114 RepID=UPI00112C53A5|nr:3-deoxy-manno-octulosonate-8-phosphatase KdsC [Methylomonas koyamae]TPQ28393.1 3-deoxy-manno-octulosonate-8-phosphatase KdsC [Methylomonas koyamae]
MFELSPEQLAIVRELKLLVLDVDGVLTDGRLFFDDGGREYKCFHARDGHGIKLLRQTGVEVAVISGRKSNSVTLRMQGLGVEHVYQGHENKRAAFADVLQRLNLQSRQVAYVGDDVLDLPVMRQVGFAVAVQDANFAVLAHAHWQTKVPGGLGAVREVCDLIMHAQGTLDAVLHNYL